MSFSNKALLEAKPVLPRSVYVRGGALYYVSFEKATQKQRWYRLGTEWNSESKRIWSDLVVRHRSGAHSSRLIYSEGDGPIPLKFLREQLANAKKNAKSRNLECTITIEDLKRLAEASEGRCSLTGIQFEFGAADELYGTKVRRKRVWAPSLDRLKNDVGYTPKNIRLVCMAVNAARQEFGDDVLLKMARALSNIQSFQENRRPSAPAKSSTYEDLPDHVKKKNKVKNPASMRPAAKIVGPTVNP